jgi:hypothetical protein
MVTVSLVQHLDWVERWWMCWGFVAGDSPAYPPGGDEAEWTITAEVMAVYRDEVTRTTSLVAASDLADGAPSLGRILFHLL